MVLPMAKRRRNRKLKHRNKRANKGVKPCRAKDRRTW